MNELYTIEDIAKMLGVERHLATKIIKEKMVYIRLSERAIRIRRQDFESYLENSSVKPEPQKLP